MTRYDFGGTTADFVFSTQPVLGRRGVVTEPATLTFWSAATGGARYTDLRLGGSPVTSITTTSEGMIPRFEGPNDVAAMWADTGSGPRLLTQLAPGQAAVLAESSRAQAEAARAGAQSAQAGAQTARDEAMEYVATSSSIALGDAEAALVGQIPNPSSPIGGALSAAIGAGVAPVQAGLDAVPAKITTQVAARFGGARVIAFGDSLTSPDGGSPVGQGWVEHVKTRSEGRFALVRNAGIPGNTTTQMLARVQADVIAYTPQHVTFMGGTNDITAGASQATMRANVEGIWAAIKAAGATMSVLSIPPRSLADKKLSETARWNSWLRNFARREGLHFIDIHKHLVAPATGGFLSPYGNTDNLHFSREGAAKVGDVVLAELVPRLPLAGIDVPVHNVDPTNLIANGLLLAGTDSAPTGWSYNALAAGVTRGRVDDADFAGGKAWQTTVDGTQVADVTSQLSANAATGWAAGDRLRFVARFKVVSCDPISQTVGDAAGQKGLGVTALFYGAPSGAVRALVRYQSLAGHGGIAWADVTVPAGTTGPVQIALAVVMPAGKAGVFRQGQASILNLTEMGLP